MDREQIVERLSKEWIKHKKIIIAVDFDDTIFPWGFKEFKDIEFYEHLIKELIMFQQIGAYIVVFTASEKERYDFIRNYLAEKGLIVDGINENVIPSIPYGKNGKIYYNILLCDRAGIFEALENLRRAKSNFINDVIQS